MSSLDKLTVGDLIDYLQANFKPDDKLCMWFEGGVYMSCEHVPKCELGHTIFKYVKTQKERLKQQCGTSDNELKDDFKYVEDDDVIMF